MYDLVVYPRSTITEIISDLGYSVFYENSFKYAERVQAEDRTHRIGQTRRPTYIDVYASCGIERRIAEAIVRKEDVAQSFRRAVDRAGAEEAGRIFGDL